MLVASFDIPPGAFALEHLFEELPETSVRAERIVAHGTDVTMPGLWISSSDFDAVDAHLSEEPAIETVVAKSADGTEQCYVVEWSDEILQLVDRFLAGTGAILRARGSATGWTLRIRFATRDQFDAFRACLDDGGYSFRLRQLSRRGSSHAPDTRITPPQREALLAAAETGYYDIPRRTNTRELASQLEMSHQALSEVLRRGTHNLIEASLTDGAGRLDDMHP